MKNVPFWIYPLIIFCVLVVGASRMHDLWGDEAETALFGQAIVRTGIPVGWDGTNIMGIGNASVLNASLINHTSPPLQYYVTALSFRLFGASAFAARFPFVLISLASIPLLWGVAFACTKSRRIALIATMLLATSVQWILFAAQARYYALTTVFGLCMLYASLHVEKRATWWNVAFVGSTIAFFYAHYVSMAAWFVALVMVYCFKREWVRARWLIVLGMFVAVGCIPWFVSMDPIASRGGYVLYAPREMLTVWYVYFTEGWRTFQTSEVFPVGMLMFVAIVWIKALRRRLRQWEIGTPAVLILTYLCLMTTATVFTQVDTLFVQQRYTTVVIPLFMLLCAMGIDAIWRFRKDVGVIAFVLLVGTNIWSLSSPRSLLVMLVGEIVRPYETPNRRVASYLRDHAKVGDTAFVSLDRDHEPLMFLLGDRIRFVNRVSLINSRIFPKNRSVLPRYVWDFRGAPDWVILYGKRGNDGSFLTFDYRSLPADIDLSRDYEMITIPLFFSDLSRPEIERRSFTAVAANPTDYVYLYHKKNLVN